MAAKYSQVSGVIRTYEDTDSYKKRDAYLSIVSVVWASEKRVVLFGAHGNGRKRHMLEAFAELYTLGARTVEMARTKGHKMPFGVLIRAEGNEDWYEINLDTVLKK